MFTFIVRHHINLQLEYYRTWEIQQSHEDPDGESHPSCCKQAANEKASGEDSQGRHEGMR